MSLSVLHVLSPFVSASADALGDSELSFRYLDNAVVRAGHRSVVVASQDSEVAGLHVRTPALPQRASKAHKAEWLEQHRRTIERTLRRERVDLLHLHSADFLEYLPEADVPILVTLHGGTQQFVKQLAAEFRRKQKREIYLQCTGYQQQRLLLAAGVPGVLPAPIEYGTPEITALAQHEERGDFALCLASICPQSGSHVALKAGRRAGVAVRLAGRVVPQRRSLRYHLQQILPRLDCERRFLGSLDLVQRREWLASAKCLLLPRRPTGSRNLLIGEALAAGTPVIAFDSPAPSGLIRHGITGFIVRNAMELASALQRVDGLLPQPCRALARTLPSIQQMTAQYLLLYHRLAGSVSVPELCAFAS
jgi:glycosyltransferase involved in cell wall biosynthesis